MRVALVAHSERRVGGAEAYVGAIVPALERAGYDVATWFEGAYGPGDPIFPSNASRPSWTAAGNPAAALRALAAWRPHLVFVHGLQSVVTERAIVGIAPAVAFAHSYYGTCISGSKCHEFPRTTPCSRTFGVGCLARFHVRRCGGLSPVTMIEQFDRQRRRLHLLGAYSRVVVASRHMAREYERHGLGGKVRVVGLPAPEAAKGALRTRTTDTWRLLYLGRLETTKGAHLLLEIAALVAQAAQHPVQLDIAGEGSLRVEIERRATELGGRTTNLAVRFHGHLSPDGCARLIAASHLLLVPSCWPEPFGLVGLEAAVSGVPAIAFDVGGIRDWLDDGRTGVLVGGPPDHRRFAAAVVRLLADPAGLGAMGERAREHARRFAMDRHVERLTSVFAEVAPVGTKVETR